jgi:hypothetical protein
MSMSRLPLRTIVLLTLSLIAVPAAAQQTTTAPFEPRVGQAGKDVVWVPTPQVLVDKMLDMAQVTPKDFLMDLGSGDGITVITAAKRGTRAVGIEYNPDMAALSTKRAADAQVSAMARFEKADLFETDLSKATVVTMFLLPSINIQLRPKILDLKPGTRVVSNTFTMEDWEPDQKETVEPCERWCTALMWIVPAKVDGTWQTPKGALTIAQKFQTFTGTLAGEPVTEGKLRGEEITFRVAGVQYSGRVDGQRIAGQSTADGKATPWSATR